VKSLLLVLTVISSAKLRSFARMVLESAGHRVIEAEGSAQAYSLLSNGVDPDLVLCEVSSQGSFEFEEQCKFLKCARAQKVCLISKMNGREEVQSQAAVFGIPHLLTTPLTSGDLERLIEEVCQSREAPRVTPGEDFTKFSAAKNGFSYDALVREAPPVDVPGVPYVEELGAESFFLAASPKMLEIHRQVKLLADIDVNVLILGESGTGKEVIAQLIHKNSRRSREKFLKVNCAALPADLLESELFGHRQGAFTGAISDRAGKFEQANRGTVLLDEIGEIPVQMQAKLLHVLQDGQFARLGAQETTKVDVRVLAATNVQIEDALLSKTFREDLYYRLSVFTIKVPPLRERREEIPYLVEQIIRRAPVEMSKGFGAKFPSRLLDVAVAYEWRGNLRELRNFVTRTMVMRDVEAATRELESKLASTVRESSWDHVEDTAVPCVGIRSIVRDVKERTEMEMIVSALETFGWNRRRAAQYLNISYRALLYKIQQHRLRPWFATDGRKPSPGVQSTRRNAL
jgi:two-component system response regulator AtoC